MRGTEQRSWRGNQLTEPLFTKLPLAVMEAVEAAGYDLDWPLWPTTVIVAGHVVEPHPDRGVLVVDGVPLYSVMWRR